MDESFGKEYKLCSKKVMTSIFEDGKQEKVYPFLLRYLAVDLKTNTRFQIVIAVPKRKFKRAVDRNRIKRLIREAVRKKKHIIEQSMTAEEPQLALFLIYTSNEEETYQRIINKIEALFLRLVESKA
ncbi:ribonuclease P protein component [Brumimicrobium glaciale]|uniref:Ribonuclease P protein component n=1 Tax=Brumimicrobium glaciale TaxID=200475 RepID=A0A4V1WFP6_9FLAO|nr:ribonuclease P protein component [Brumimicrobium glaciale]RYM33926.1 ribonuclease P protein component [Brumimicrobium glaciale]